LEFHTVVVPFCEWEMDETRQEQLVWHENTTLRQAQCTQSLSPEPAEGQPQQDDLFNRMSLIPLNYGKLLKHSRFFTDFENETLKLWVDNLNLLYVALTRPKHNLWVLADALPKKSEKLRVSNLLHNSVIPLVEGIFREGQLVSSTEKHNEIFDGNVFKIPLENTEIPFSVAQKQPTFYISDETRRWYENLQNDCNAVPVGARHASPFAKGLLYHQILANIRHLEDVENTIEKFVFNGFISENETTSIATTIRELLNNPTAQDWFSKKHRIFNECKIVNRSVCGHLERRRPDRVMQDEYGNLILVDFKTGQKYPKHHEQIREYSALLREMFSGDETRTITGFLWYLDANEIEQVNSNS
jgi:ATP-dependent exoDNAse (exonuclease V) beta subunit